MKSIFFLQNTLIMVSADISTYRLLLAIFHYKYHRSYFPLRIGINFHNEAALREVKSASTTITEAKARGLI